MIRDGQEELPEPKPVTIEDVQQVFILIDRYWTAVKNAFPQPWQDRTNYILLQTIGLTAFSKLGADVIQNQVYEAESYEHMTSMSRFSTCQRTFRCGVRTSWDLPDYLERSRFICDSSSNYNPKKLF